MHFIRLHRFGERALLSLRECRFGEMGMPQHGARTVPVRSTQAGRGALDRSDVFRPDNPLRTGTVRAPIQRYVPTRLIRYEKERRPGERSPRTLCAPWTPEPRDVRPLLPLFPTQEGGEGRGEEDALSVWPLSPALAPRVPRRERERARE